MITRRRIFAAVVCLVAFAAVAGTALATLPSGQTVTLLVRGHAGTLHAQAQGVQIERDGGSADVAMLSVSYAPGGSSGWHHHPGVGLVAVQSGAVTFYDDNCNRHTYTAGQVFVEQGTEPGLVRNNGSTTALVYATFVIPSNTPVTGLRIDDLQPADCNAH